MKKGFREEYFANYGYWDDKSFEASFRISDVIFNPTLTKYKKLHNAIPDTYVELGCGNGFYINKMLKLGTRSCVGCDFSKHFDNNIICPKENFFKDDSIHFLQNINYQIDMVYEGTAQYLNNSDMDTLFTLLSKKVKSNGVLGLIYDESDNHHLYRKQKHSVKEWQKILKKYGFKSTKSQYVFIKE